MTELQQPSWDNSTSNSSKNKLVEQFKSNITSYIEDWEITERELSDIEFNLGLTKKYLKEETKREMDDLIKSVKDTLENNTAFYQRNIVKLHASRIELIKKALATEDWKEKVEEWSTPKEEIKFDNNNEEVKKLLSNKDYPFKTQEEIAKITTATKATERYNNYNWIDTIKQWTYVNWKMQWEWICILADWDKYVWGWKDDNFEWKWIFTYADWGVDELVYKDGEPFAWTRKNKDGKLEWVFANWKYTETSSEEIIPSGEKSDNVTLLETREVITDLPDWSTGEVITKSKKWRLNIRDNADNVLKLLNNWNQVILTWKIIDLSRGQYYEIKYDWDKIWYVSAQYIGNIKRFEPTKPTAPWEETQQVKVDAKVATPVKVDVGDNDDLWNEESLRAADVELRKAIADAEIAVKSWTTSDLDSVQENLAKAIEKWNDTQKRVKGDWWEVLEWKTYLSKDVIKGLEAGDTMEIAKWRASTTDWKKYTYEEQQKLSSSWKKFKKDWEGSYYNELDFTENTFEMYKKDGKYILEMNGSWVFDDKTEFYKIPTNTELKDRMDFMMKHKFGKEENQKFEIL